MIVCNSRPIICSSEHCISFNMDSLTATVINLLSGTIFVKMIISLTLLNINERRLSLLFRASSAFFLSVISVVTIYLSKKGTLSFLKFVKRLWIYLFTPSPPVIQYSNSSGFSPFSPAFFMTRSSLDFSSGIARSIPLVCKAFSMGRPIISQMRLFI